MRFDALELALVIVSRLRHLLPAIRRHDARLHKQIRDAGASMLMHLGEGNRRRGQDRSYLFTVASGSAEEVRLGIRVAIAWGYLSETSADEVLEYLARFLAVSWKLTH